MRFPDLPIYRGFNAPSRVEADVTDLEVEGRVPESLNGILSGYRCVYATDSMEPGFRVRSSALFERLVQFENAPRVELVEHPQVFGRQR